MKSNTYYTYYLIRYVYIGFMSVYSNRNDNQGRTQKKNSGSEC